MSKSLARAARIPTYDHRSTPRKNTKKPSPKRTVTISSKSATRTVTPLKKETPASPIVYYSLTAWQKLWILVSECNQEIGWLGTVTKRPDGNFIIEDIYIPKQVVSAATTEIEPEAVAELALELDTSGIDPSTLRYWGHSHVNMDVSPSLTDELQIEEYLDSADWFIRGIYNKLGKSKVDIYDTKANLIFQCVENLLEPAPLPPGMLEEIQKQIQNNVTEESFVYVTPANPLSAFDEYDLETEAGYLAAMQDPFFSYKGN